MDNEKFWIVMGRHLAGESSIEDEAALNKMLEESLENKLRYDAIKTYWGKNKQHTEAEVERAYSEILTKLDLNNAPTKEATSYSIVSYSLKIAASFLILISAYLYMFSFVSTEELVIALTWKVKETNHGERSKLTLSDGSTVWLNADSELKYPKEFESDNREVYLTGEAFFDVTKNPKQPFIIHLENGDVRVLGTSFNIRAFKDDAVVETSVVTGKVAFIPTAGKEGLQKDTILLTPNYKAVYTKFSGLVKKQKTNSIDDKAWADGRLIFKSQRFEEVAKVLERNFGKTIVFNNEAIKNCKLTGTFQNNTLEEVLKLFAQTKDYTYTISENELRVNGIGCSEE